MEMKHEEQVSKYETRNKNHAVENYLKLQLLMNKTRLWIYFFVHEFIYTSAIAKIRISMLIIHGNSPFPFDAFHLNYNKNFFLYFFY